LKNNSKLTLKQLKQELENLKKNKNNSIPKVGNTTKSAIGHEIKYSKIQRLYMKSSGFMLFLITGILGYAHKVLVIRNILSLLSLWYGKTTIWKILVKIRKIFIIFNSIIGVYLVYKTTGFSTDIILASFAGMGHTYLEILINFTKRLFNWFFELFDYKVVPNIPGEGASKPKIKTPFWNPSVTHDPWIGRTHNKLYELNNFDKDWFKYPINLNINHTPWYKDWSTWLWIGGGLILIGIIYVGYKLVMDPLFLESIFNKSSVNNPQSPINPSDNPSINPNYVDPGYGSDIIIGERISNTPKLLKNLFSKLNPLNWINSPDENKANYQAFIAMQENINQYNNKLYSFTSNNPYDPWFKKLKLRLIGESITEYNGRLEYKNYIMKEVANILNKGKEVNTPFTPNITLPNTPSIGTLGLSKKYTSGLGLIETIQASSSHKEVLNKLIPLLNVNNLPIPNIDLGANWDTNVVDKDIDLVKMIRDWKNKKSIGNVVSNTDNSVKLLLTE
jgi:hypothetical protein